MRYLLFIIICLVGSLYHIAFFHLNDILKVADSFAYLQMSYFLGELSEKGLGSGWFGFLYSLPVAIVDIFIGNDFLAAKIVNIILFNISAVLLYQIAKNILTKKFSLLVVILFFLSPTLLHFNIHVLSENIYIPLFLGVFLLTYRFTESFFIDRKRSFFKFWSKKETSFPRYSYIIAIACLIGCMYLTRAEAFIYLGSIGLISFGLLYLRKLSPINFIKLGSVFLLSFFLFISPYLYHLQSLTGEWGLTNKGASNLRQAELRGQDHMDDAGFEQAVAELTPDNTKLIAGFAGGMDYVKPQIEGSLPSFIASDPGGFAKRVFVNYRKFFTQNFPELLLGKAPSLYFGDNILFSNFIFLGVILIPFLVLLYGLVELYRYKEIFFYISFSFFIPAFVFFNIFFVLNRYYLIFVPLLFIALVYGLQRLTLKKYGNIISSIGVIIILIIFGLSTLVYYNIESPKDEYYALKKEAGLWLNEYCSQEIRPEICLKNNKIFEERSFGSEGTTVGVRIFDSMSFVNEGKKSSSTNTTNSLQIMERFPIVTYYSGAKTRFITPYTDDIQDIYEYAKFNNIDILVIDTMDFETYRPELREYLEETPEGFILLQSFQNINNQKVILYQVN